MIILDTNVVSELLRPKPDANVIAWLDAEDVAEIYLTAVTAGELRAGVAIMPAGKRRTALGAHIEAHIEDTFAGRVLGFDVACMRNYAVVHDQRRRRGKPITTEDAQIAAIALTHDATLATRNVKDFVDVGLELIDPWNDPPG